MRLSISTKPLGPRFGFIDKGHNALVLRTGGIDQTLDDGQ